MSELDKSPTRDDVNPPQEHQFQLFSQLPSDIRGSIEQVTSERAKLERQTDELVERHVLPGLDVEKTHTPGPHQTPVPTRHLTSADMRGAREGSPDDSSPVAAALPDWVRRLRDQVAERSVRGVQDYVDEQNRKAAKVLFDKPEDAAKATPDQIRQKIISNIKALADGDFDTREAAIDTLKKAGLPAVAPLLSAMMDPETFLKDNPDLKDSGLTLRKSGARVLSHLCGKHEFFSGAHGMERELEQLRIEQQKGLNPNANGVPERPAGDPYRLERDRLLQVDLKTLFPKEEMIRFQAFKAAIDEVRRAHGGKPTTTYVKRVFDDFDHTSRLSKTLEASVAPFRLEQQIERQLKAQK